MSLEMCDVLLHTLVVPRLITTTAKHRTLPQEGLARSPSRRGLLSQLRQVSSAAHGPC